MPVFSTAYVKAAIGRGFKQIADPVPSAAAIATLWKYFESRCAYCRKPLSRRRKDGHIDHLMAASAAGRNGIGNRVLACAKCNEAGKRETSWESFLRERVHSQRVRAVRRNRIRRWQKRNVIVLSARQRAIDHLAKQSAADVVALFERRVKALRTLKRDRLSGRSDRA